MEQFSSKDNTPQSSEKRVKHAVILAAGKSQRFRDKGTKKPKVLLKVGGLRLLERSILTLREAGVVHFRIVLGAYRQQILEEMQTLPSLKKVDVEYVECEDFELGNGVSFGAGAAGIEEPFLLTMSDHIFSPTTIQQFVTKALEEPELPALACDPDLENVFDMDDATKVFSNNGKIQYINKQLTDYDLVDTGLFYFPKNFGNAIAAKAKAGATSVSNIIQQFIDGEGVRATSLDNAMWQDVDYPGMKKEAERRLMQTIVNPNDGWIARNINRVFSTRISLQLAKLDIHPNWITTFVLFLTLVGAWLAASGNYLWIVGGAIIFQIASILDGCDGELARLTYKHSWFGAVYGRLVGDLRFGLFFGALGVSAYRATGSEVYLFAIIIFIALIFYLIIQIVIFSSKQKERLSGWQPDKKPAEKKTSDSILSNKFFHFWHELNKEDVFVFVGFLLCTIFLYEVMFWLALIGTIIMAISTSRKIKAIEGAEAATSLFGKIDPIIFYLFGVSILCILIYNMELSVVVESLSEVGNTVFLVFATAILWILCDTLCISTLLRHKVSFHDLLFNQLTGNAYNAIIPLAGLGGEPYKIKHLTNWLDWHTASRSIVQDRLIHSLSGILFTAITVGITVVILPLEQQYLIPMTIAAVVLGIFSFVMMWVTLSNAPSRISGFILKKLNFLEDFKNEQLPLSRFLTALFWKMLGRAFNLAEIYMIFTILGFTPGIVELVTVAGLIALSATIFFVIPQGLGVNEVGISSALALLGYTSALGLTFGLIRRARMIFWALFGVALHLATILFKKVIAVRLVEK